MTAPRYAEPAEQAIFERAATVIGEEAAAQVCGDQLPSAMQAAANAVLGARVRLIVAQAAELAAQTKAA